MNYVEKAEQYFSNNFNCAQAVFATFAKDLGLDEETALKIGTPFGSGARKGEICGAVSGALMVLGYKYATAIVMMQKKRLRHIESAKNF